MAILKSLEADNYQANRLTTTNGRYSVSVYQGEKLFHIRTFGAADRENPGKVSQQLDLNAEMARELCELLKKEFRFD